MIEEFKKYVRKYDFNDYRIKGKFNHSFDVMKMCVYLAKKLRLSKEDVEIAKQIGLLHDIGRFEQLKKYDTFNDAISVNHGEYAVDVLFEDNYIKKFNIKKENYNIIKIAILNHNKNAIDDNLSERETLFCKIIRDADKLDIFKIVQNYINIKDTNVDENIKKEFFNNQKTTMSYEKNDADILVRVLSYIYDINLKESFKYVAKKRLLEKLAKKINNKEFDEYFKNVIKFVNERID